MYHLREVQGGQPHQLLRWKRLFRVSVGTYEKCRVVNPINYSDGNDYSVYLSECTGDCVVIWKISCVSRLERMVLARVLYNLKRLWLLVYMFWAHSQVSPEHVNK
eukprot:g46009.t1